MRKLSKIALVLTAGALVAAACGSDNSSSSSDTPTTASGSATTAGGTGTSAASGGATGQGVTPTTITVGVVAGLSGPFAEPIKDFIEGFYVWQREVNAAGGIGGRQIEVKEYDHGETADGGVAACKSIVADKAVYVPFEIQGAIAHLTAANCLDEAGVTNLVWQASDDFIGKWKHTFAPFATPTVQGQVTARYIKSQLQPSDKVAFAIGSADIFKTAGDAMKAELEKLGANVVSTQYIEQTGTTFIPQLQAMKDAGATVVAMSTVGSETTLLKEAETIGFSPKWTGNGYAYDYLPAGSPGVYDGVTATSLSKATDTPAFADYLKVAEKYAKSKCQVCAQQFLAYGQGKLLGAVLAAAGPDFTTASLAKAAESITSFDTTVYAPITWTASNHVGTEELYPFKCCSSENAWQSDGTPSAEF
jgi:ABC-type branched-subunit amino acid transport system substrate-binding protein